MKRLRILTLCAAACAAAFPSCASAALGGAARSLLQNYLGALVAGRYDTAFALLSPSDRKYFRSSANYASVFAADRLKIDAFTILGSKSDKLGTVALVSERIEFFDQRLQSTGNATAKVAYGIVAAPHGFAIKDPFHPWRALAPADLSATVNGVQISVRKISFFTGRMEVIATFANRSDTTVTLLPYGRTSVRDESGKSYPAIASRHPGLTDKTLYTGLRLSPSARYTGLMTFLTPDRFAPKTLGITFAPALDDGADAPFEIPLPVYALPS